MNQDLTSARTQIAEGRTSALDAIELSISAARSDANLHTYTRLDLLGPRASATQVDALRKAGAPLAPLGGLAISVKDLFDVHGEVTTAGSTVLADRAPAGADCPAVARLRRAGAALLGRTNMSEFAFSGVGINPHHGTPANPATARLDPVARIPGGSTSGGAVSVASGAAWAALGSDTGGSLRIPAALQGLVGYKGTARLTPTQGAVPLSTTLDTAGAITRSVRDAVLLHELLADRTVALTGRPLHAHRFAVPDTLMLDALEPGVAAAFERSLDTLRRAGAQIDTITLAPLAEVAQINAGGGFSPVEAWAWHRKLLADHGATYDPRVALRIRRGEHMSGADYIDLLAARADWIARMRAASGSPPGRATTAATAWRRPPTCCARAGRSMSRSLALPPRCRPTPPMRWRAQWLRGCASTRPSARRLSPVTSPSTPCLASAPHARHRARSPTRSGH